MGAPMASRTILLLFLGLTFTVSTHCVPSLQEKSAKTRDGQGIDRQRFDHSGHFALRRSANDLKRIVHDEEDDTERASKWPTVKVFEPGLRSAQSWRRKEEAGLTVKPIELGTVSAREWPDQFTVNFTTKSGTATGFVAYDWSQKRQIVYHGPKSSYCEAFGTEDDCQMYEFPGGTYSYIPSQESCILTVADVGTLPPEWTTHSEYVGVEEIQGVGLCRGFAFPPTAHIWYETVDGSLPCLFVFPEPTMSYYFDPKTFVVGKPDEKYFDFPDYCFTAGDAVKKVDVE